MLKKIISRLMLNRASRPIAAALSASLLFVLVASLAACSSVTMPNQKSALAQPLDQSAFKVRDLAVSPVNVSKGEAVTIIANVINTSAREGVYNAELKINNARVTLNAVTIPAGVTQTLNFIVPASSPGTYEATFGDLSGKYTVADNSTNVVPVSNITSSDFAPAAAAVPSQATNSPQITSSNPASSPSSAAPSCHTPSSPTTPTTSGWGKAATGGGCCGK